MSQAALFRSIVVVSALLYVVSYFLPYESLESAPAAVNLLKLDGYGARFNPQSWFFTSGVLMLWLLATVGLLHFDNWARYMYLALTAWAFIAAGLYGIRVTPPLEAVLDQVIGLLDGVILGLAFLSPLKENFKRPSAS